MDTKMPLCKECRNACFQTNKEKIAARDKAYRQANKEKIAARDKAYRQAKKGKIETSDEAYPVTPPPDE